MSDSANVERFAFAHEGVSHGLRALFARPRGTMTQQEFDALAPHITNVHVIPASEAVYSDLRRVKIGELVTLRGLRARRRRPHRDDVGDGRRPRLRNHVAGGNPDRPALAAPGRDTQ
jgi:hypothetical protein